MSAPSPSEHLFVYGTLRRSTAHPVHPLLAPATFAGLGTLPGKLYDLGHYPGAVLDLGAGEVVQGEIYVLHDPAPTLERLDRYEGCTEENLKPHEYVRVLQRIDSGANAPVMAWIYLYQWPVDPRRQVATGDWTQR